MATNKYGAVCAAADCQTYVPPGGGVLIRAERGWLTYCPADDPNLGKVRESYGGPRDPDDEGPHESVVVFLHERLEEELAAAGAAGITPWRHWPRRSQRVVDGHDELVVETSLRVVADHIATWGPWPAILNAESRYMVINLFEEAEPGPAREALRDAVRALAMAYREHPDYDPAWTLHEP
ncbi:DUF6221 family protein [Kitasatospora sp. NPDC048194]|uniref:DUF6221 family protein n=1 Tax=Kitasatospora sp. NPDC048194 TaxID=3364045 RepID=UPI003723803B